MGIQYNINWNKSIPWALVVIGLVVHFLFIGSPNSAVFDEVHFGKFISAYFTHEYYFDIHPPLGKMMLAGWGWIWGFKPGFSFANIGDVFPDRSYIALRFLPSLAGAFLPLVIYGIARRMRIRTSAAFLAGLLVALDNALLTQSRYILLDSFLLLCGFSAVYCYLSWRQGGSRWLLPFAGILGALAMSVKWTGATFLGIIVLLELLHLWQDRNGTARLRLRVVFASLAVLPLLTYAIPYAAHFMLLPKSGPGDAFMSARFQHGLSGSTYADDASLKPLSMPVKIFELNREMYRANQRLTATHPYSSPWYSWPVMRRTVFYWVKDLGRIYLIGNPVVWWLSTLAVLWAVADTLMRRVIRADTRQLALLGAWAVNLFPFIFIGRVMFLYHYLTAFVWAVLLLALLVDRLRRPTGAVIAIGTLALAAFVFFAPLSYGLPLTENGFNVRMMFSSWR
jgi:dolichyl-phosphate-mannose--protein O-mannosyl transferase